MTITSAQAQKLEVLPYQQLSPHLQNCCLHVSAIVSYAKAEEEVAYLTGIRVPAKTQQRLVHRQTFAQPVAATPIEEVCVDGGKVRLRTPLGQKCEWNDYKVIATEQGTLANLHNNTSLVSWINGQSLAQPVTCLADGHDGVWNLIEQIATPSQRREILDWYHLKENLFKLEVSAQQLKQGEALLWKGKVKAILRSFDKNPLARKFCKYVRKHHTRIVNYQNLQTRKICAIGSGRVESAVKQIDARLHLPGAQWKAENVPQVLAHRCAYLNGLIGSQIPRAS